MVTKAQQESIKKPFRKLEFSYLNKDDIVLNLRQLSVKYKVHYNRLRSCHWKIQCSDSHELNKEFESRYQIIQNKIDGIAGRIYNFNQPPQMTIEEVLKNASPKERLSIVGLLNSMNDIIRDFGDLHDAMLEVRDSSLHNSGTATKHVKTEFIKDLVRRNQMLIS